MIETSRRDPASDLSDVKSVNRAQCEGQDAPGFVGQTIVAST